MRRQDLPTRRIAIAIRLGFGTRDRKRVAGGRTRTCGATKASGPEPDGIATIRLPHFYIFYRFKLFFISFRVFSLPSLASFLASAMSFFVFSESCSILIIATLFTRPRATLIYFGHALAKPSTPRGFEPLPEAPQAPVLSRLHHGARTVRAILTKAIVRKKAFYGLCWIACAYLRNSMNAIAAKSAGKSSRFVSGMLVALVRFDTLK